jgi:glycogen synthase
MNLCLTCRDVRLDSHSGLSRSMCDLAEALAGGGHSVHLLTDVSGASPPGLRGVSIEMLPVPPASGPWAGAQPESAPHNLLHAAAVYREVRRVHECERPVDAVLAPLWRSEGAVCLLDDRFPTIVSCMTSLRTLAEIDGAYNRLPDIDERLWLEGEGLARSRYLHGLTEAVLAKTIADYRLRPAATTVIGRGLRDWGRGTNRREPGDGRTTRVLFVGRIEHRKGVDTLLAAAGELIEEGVAVSFTIAGPNTDPSFRESFEREAADRPRLRAAVRFTGAVLDAELHRLYVESDIVCVPSRYESHGVVLVEAMMFGKPIVTCDAGGIGEVVRAGRNAVVSPPEDSRALAESLRRLSAAPELRAKLGADARDTYEQRFDVEVVARHMESFLEDVISVHNRQASDVKGRLETLLRDAPAITRPHARALAGELLDPPASAWRAWAQERGSDRADNAPCSSTGEIGRLREAIASQAETITFLRRRHETRYRVEQGDWRRLSGGPLLALRKLGRLRARWHAHGA